MTSKLEIDSSHISQDRIANECLEAPVERDLMPSEGNTLISWLNRIKTQRPVHPETQEQGDFLEFTIGSSGLKAVYITPSFHTFDLNLHPQQ